LPGAAPLLEALARRYRLVAILSGRRAEDVHGLIPVPSVRYVGLYGAEELEGGRLTERPPAADRAGVAGALVAEADELLRGDDLADAGSLRRAGELLGPGALRVGVRSAEGPPELAEVSDVMVRGPDGVLALLGRFA